MRKSAWLKPFLAIVILVFAMVRSAGSQGASIETLSSRDRDILRAAFDHVQKTRPEVGGAATRLIEVTLRTCAAASGASRERCVESSLLDLPLQEDVRAQMPGCSGLDYVDLHAAFTARNGISWRLGVFQPELEITRAAEGGATDANRKFLQFSAPGYSRDGRFALVYVTEFCPFDCGWGVLTALQQTPDGWRALSCGVGWLA